MYLWQTAVLAWLKSPMERSTFQPEWSPRDTSGHLPREPEPVLQLGYCLPPTLRSPPRWRRPSPFHLTVASQAGELCDKRSRRQLTLAGALQTSQCAWGTCTHPARAQGRQAAALQLLQVCEKDTSGMECPLGFCGHTGKSLPQRGSDAKKPQG